MNIIIIASKEEMNDDDDDNASSFYFIESYDMWHIWLVLGFLQHINLVKIVT
jgi:hypothetical protein